MGKDFLKTVYVYDGTFEGLLSAVYMAYYGKDKPDEICEEANYIPQFWCNKINIETDMEKYKAVYNSIINKISGKSLNLVYYLYLSGKEDKATVIYNYLRLGYKIGSKVEQDLGNEWVMRALKLSKYVKEEAHKLTGFVRFEKMNNGVYFSKIAPVNNVMEILCRYFRDRMPSEAWVIYDTNRHLAGIYDTKKCMIRTAEELGVLEYDEKEESYQKLWKTFFESVNIEERANYKCQRNLLPKRYRGTMTEFH